MNSSITCIHLKKNRYFVNQSFVLVFLSPEEQNSKTNSFMQRNTTWMLSDVLYEQLMCHKDISNASITR